MRQLVKTYRVPVREAGLRAAVVSLFRRDTRDVEAVREIDFEVAQGEIVGFLGPNGAGKTTTLKMLSGLLHETSGEIDVLGYRPQRREHDFLRQITLVMGQRNQLLWDIPVIDSFDRNRAIYEVSPEDYRRTLDELTDLLEMGELLHKPVRNLSLGERMKCEVGLALLHAPRVLFLDEPTIGLDVTMQRRLREFVREHNRRTGASVLLTSHYMADIEALCERVLVIHHGKLLFDGPLAGLVDRFAAYKTISVEPADPDVDLAGYGEVISRNGARITLRVSRSDTPRVTASILAEQRITDLTVEDPAIEDVIERVFEQGAV